MSKNKKVNSFTREELIQKIHEMEQRKQEGSIYYAHLCKELDRIDGLVVNV